MSSLLRQVKDIQIQGSRLINRKSNLAEINQFSQYSDELKKYLFSNSSDSETLKLVREIPNIFQEEDLVRVKRTALMAFLSYFSFPWFIYFRDRSKIEIAKRNIKTAIGQYASIEFLIKNQLS